MNDVTITKGNYTHAGAILIKNNIGQCEIGYFSLLNAFGKIWWWRMVLDARWF